MKPKTCISVCLLKIMNAAREAATGEPIDAPSCPYKLQPDYQGKTNQLSDWRTSSITFQKGKLLWITGSPGAGKSTSAQRLARDKG